MNDEVLFVLSLGYVYNLIDIAAAFVPMHLILIGTNLLPAARTLLWFGDL